MKIPKGFGGWGDGLTIQVIEKNKLVKIANNMVKLKKKGGIGFALPDLEVHDKTSKTDTVFTGAGRAAQMISGTEEPV